MGRVSWAICEELFSEPVSGLSGQLLGSFSRPKPFGKNLSIFLLTSSRRGLDTAQVLMTDATAPGAVGFTGDDLVGSLQRALRGGSW